MCADRTTKMNRRWICSDVWMDILPSFDHTQLGLKMALLSDRFDILVDAHFDGKSELTIWRMIKIDKDKGPKPKMSIQIGDNDNFVDFPLSDRQMPNKICFKNIQILYIDHSVIKFLHSKKRFYDRSGTNLEFNLHWVVQPICDVFVREIWPIFVSNIRRFGFRNGAQLDNLRRLISPTLLTDLDQLTSIDSGFLFLDGIADDGPNATAGQALTKWLHTPTKNGQPKRLCRNNYLSRLNLEWVNNFKETFCRATTSVSYAIQLYFFVDTMPIEQFELVNERTKEKLTLKMSEEYNGSVYNWLLKRCPIGETATAPIKWKNRQNLDANLNNIQFIFWGGSNCIGPLSPPAKEEEEADQSNQNVV